METVYFVILTWNSENVIAECLDSLLSIRNRRIHIYVVDNGSTDSTLSVIETYRTKVADGQSLELFSLERNYGTTISRNIAIRKALETASDTDYICVLDSDTQVTEAAIETLVRELTRDPKNGVVGPQMVGDDGAVQESGRDIPTIQEKLTRILFDKGTTEKASVHRAQDTSGTHSTGAHQAQDTSGPDSPHTVGYLLSACWMMRASLFRTIGLLDEKIFYAPEDVEFCIRVWENGQRVLYCPNARIRHQWQRLSRKKLFSKHNVEHIKGLLYMFGKHRYWFSAKKIQKLMF